MAWGSEFDGPCVNEVNILYRQIHSWSQIFMCPVRRHSVYQRIDEVPIWVSLRWTFLNQVSPKEWPEGGQRNV